MTDRNEPKTPEAPIDRSNVLSVYSGKPGCCCGCRGKHTYRKDPELRALGERDRGYGINDDEVNEGQVTRVLNVMNASLADVEEYDFGWSLDLPHRVYIAYKVDHVKAWDEAKAKKAIA